MLLPFLLGAGAFLSVLRDPVAFHCANKIGHVSELATAQEEGGWRGNFVFLGEGGRDRKSGRGKRARIAGAKQPQVPFWVEEKDQTYGL